MKKRRMITDPLLMLISIIGITAFLVYWLRENYIREEKTLEARTEMIFRESVMKLQVAKLKLNSVQLKKSGNKDVRIVMAGKEEGEMQLNEGEGLVSTINVIRDKLSDSLRVNHKREGKAVMIAMQTARELKEGKDSLRFDLDIPAPPRGPGNHVFNFLYGVDSLQDSIKITEIDSVYALALKKQRLVIPYTIIKKENGEEPENSRFGTVTIGLAHPVSYSVQLGNTFPYLFRRLAQPLLFSVLLLAITILAFVILYKNLLRQRRLAEQKNEFISNITHELKTPIATVGVAIEALKNFNAMDNPERTREYLDISQNELHRLSLLVDKVLKLSMFEKQEIELRSESLDLQQVVSEVLDSLKLQLEKQKASVTLNSEGDTRLKGDRMHLLSVVFNLLDNAIKYRNGIALQIGVELKGTADAVTLKVSDNGIGIPAAYQEKIFEKFFRVPHGDTHNAKGYGLGLSYVAQVVQKHNGTIDVRSAPGEGTVFTICLPKQTV